MSDDRRTGMDFEALEALFAQARTAEPAVPPADLRARLMADALAAIPGQGSVGQGSVGRGWLARLGGVLADLGGLPGLAGVSAAGIAGVWIGVSGLGGTGDLVTQVWQGAASVSPAVSIWVDDGFLAAEGTDLLVLMSGEGE